MNITINYWNLCSEVVVFLETFLLLHSISPAVLIFNYLEDVLA